MVRGMTQRTTEDVETFLRPQVAAAMLGVTPKTLTRWAESGDIRSIRLASGQRRYSSEDVKAMQEAGAK